MPQAKLLLLFLTFLKQWPLTASAIPLYMLLKPDKKINGSFAGGSRYIVACFSFV